jgi:hypothetical protein
MLKPFGTRTCPHCGTDLVHQYRMAHDWALPNNPAHEDQQLLCPRCGYCRPVVYTVVREGRLAVAPGRFLRAIRPLMVKRYR